MNSKQQPKLAGQATDEQIKAWKAANAEGIFALQDKKGIMYFKNPDRNDLNAVLSKMDSEAPMDMFEDLAHTLKLGGDETMLSEASRFFGCVQQLKKKMDGDTVKLVNL